MPDLKTDTMKFALISFVALGALTLAAAAQSKNEEACGVSITARFIEGAPTDRFEITNNSTGGWSITSASFDLAQAPAGLVFDTEDGGGGLEVFQPFKASDSSAKLVSTSGLSDGGTALTIDFASFAPGESFAFTIDIDDSLENSARRQTQVVGNEIEGAMLSVKLDGTGNITSEIAAGFNAQAKLEAAGPAC
ncbi:MAG: hypothetical protein AAF737_00125 [Pseudomonadota bacterium]